MVAMATLRKTIHALKKNLAEPKIYKRKLLTTVTDNNTSEILD